VWQAHIGYNWTDLLCCIMFVCLFIFYFIFLFDYQKWWNKDEWKVWSPEHRVYVVCGCPHYHNAPTPSARWITRVVDGAKFAISATDNANGLAISAASHIHRDEACVCGRPRCRIFTTVSIRQQRDVARVQAIVQFAVRTLRRNNGSELTMQLWGAK